MHVLLRYSKTSIKHLQTLSIFIHYSPSTSESENLPLRYYQAEHDGWNDHCHFYEPGCGESLLELVSEPFEAILNHIETNKV